MQAMHKDRNRRTFDEPHVRPAVPLKTHEGPLKLIGDRATGTLKVSVVVATYCPGDGLERLVNSIDQQSLPEHRVRSHLRRRRVTGRHVGGPRKRCPHA